MESEFSDLKLIELTSDRYLLQKCFEILCKCERGEPLSFGKSIDRVELAVRDMKPSRRHSFTSGSRLASSFFSEPLEVSAGVLELSGERFGMSAQNGLCISK